MYPLRHFAKTVKPCCLGKIRKIFQYVVSWKFYQACYVLSHVLVYTEASDQLCILNFWLILRKKNPGPYFCLKKEARARVNFIVCLVKAQKKIKKKAHLKKKKQNPDIKTSLCPLYPILTLPSIWPSGSNLRAFLMSTHNIRYQRNKKNISTFRLKKATYLELWLQSDK